MCDLHQIWHRRHRLLMAGAPYWCCAVFTYCSPIVARCFNQMFWSDHLIERICAHLSSGSVCWCHFTACQVRADRHTMVAVVRHFGEDNRHFMSVDLVSGAETRLRDAPDMQYFRIMAVLDNYMYSCHNNPHARSPECMRYDPRFKTWGRLASLLPSQSVHRVRYLKWN